MQKSHDFSDLKVIEIPVTTPDGQHYVLSECSEAHAARWRNARMRGMQVEQLDRRGTHQKFSNLPGVGDLPALLLSGCIFPADENFVRVKGQRPVSQQVIATWWPRVVKPLYEDALDINELREEAETVEEINEQIAALQEKRQDLLEQEQAAKNVSSGTPDGSDSPESEEEAALS